jgi:pimeloyl-ACP methyl ester carboxylesterase
VGDLGVPRAEDGLAPDRRLTRAGLDVWEWGPEDGRTLLYVHGLGSAGPTSAEEAGPRWGAQGFRVVAPAAPGWFDSPLLPEEEYALSRLAARVLDTVDEPPVLVGFSWGGHIGVHAPPERLRGLVLLDGGYFDTEKRPEDELEERFRRARVGIRAEQPSTAWPRLAASGLPVLLLTRDDDVPPRPEPFLAQVPQTELHVLPGADHHILRSVRDEAIELVATWAAGH